MTPLEYQVIQSTLVNVKKFAKLPSEHSEQKVEDVLDLLDGLQTMDTEDVLEMNALILKRQQEIE